MYDMQQVLVSHRKSNIGSDNGLVPEGRQGIIWTSDSLVYRRIYVSLNLDKLTL